MSKFNKQILQKLDKSKLIRLLEREGIDASIEQPKPELIRLLMLAKRANAPTKPQSLSKNTVSQKRLTVFLIFLATILLGFSLYFYNPIFNKNINFLLNKILPNPEFVGNNTGPTIYEKNGKTYVVYDHPLIKTSVLYDPACKRPECDLETYYKQIKAYISPLITFKEIDYNSKEGQNLAKEYNLNLLPVFLFEETIQKTENFENSKKNLEKIQDKFVLQVPPNKIIKGPNLQNGQLIGKPIQENAPITIIEYASFSCKLCFDLSQTIKSLLEIYPDQVTRVIKYFNSTSKDTTAAIAAECAGKQNKFYEYYEFLFAKQNEWINYADVNLASIFLNYAGELQLDRRAFNECQNDPNTNQLVQNHYIEAGSLGLSAAPTIIVNNNVLVGTYTAKNLSAIINDILTAEGKTIKSNDEN